MCMFASKGIDTLDTQRMTIYMKKLWPPVPDPAVDVSGGTDVIARQPDW